VYFFGGKKEDGFSSNQIHVLRVGCKPLQWTSPEVSGQLPPPRYSHSMIHFEAMNAIVVFGGRNDTLISKTLVIELNFLNDLWLLSLDTLNWVKVINQGDIPIGRHSFCSAIHGTRLVIFGGLNSQQYNSNDIYLCELDPSLSKQYETDKN
jgi:hypothetical protein